MRFINKSFKLKLTACFMAAMATFCTLPTRALAVAADDADKASLKKVYTLHIKKPTGGSGTSGTQAVDANHFGPFFGFGTLHHGKIVPFTCNFGQVTVFNPNIMNLTNFPDTAFENFAGGLVEPLPGNFFSSLQADILGPLTSIGGPPFGDPGDDPSYLFIFDAGGGFIDIVFFTVAAFGIPVFPGGKGSLVGFDRRLLTYNNLPLIVKQLLATEPLLDVGLYCGEDGTQGIGTSIDVKTFFFNGQVAPIDGRFVFGCPTDPNFLD